MEYVEDVDNDLDPRIQVELENLNKFTDEINRLEIELDVSISRYLSYSVPYKIFQLGRKLDNIFIVLII